MARTVRGHQTATNPSVFQQEEQADTIESKVIPDHKPDVDYKQEESDLENVPVAKE